MILCGKCCGRVIKGSSQLGVPNSKSNHSLTNNNKKNYSGSLQHKLLIRQNSRNSNFQFSKFQKNLVPNQYLDIHFSVSTFCFYAQVREEVTVGYHQEAVRVLVQCTRTDLTVVVETFTQEELCKCTTVLAVPILDLRSLTLVSILFVL